MVKGPFGGGVRAGVGLYNLQFIQYHKATVPGLSYSIFLSKWMTQETRPTQWGFQPTPSKSERNLKPFLLFYSFDIERKCVVSKFYVKQNNQIKMEWNKAE